MSQLLHVNASPRGAASQSLTIAEAFVEAFRTGNPDVKVDSLHLFEENLPDFGTVAADAKMAAFSGQEQTPEQVELWGQARAVFDRFAAADAYVFNVPNWNAGVPYRLKHWVDVVTQPGWAFGFHPENGYNGLVTGKKAIVVYSAGVYRQGTPPAFGLDFYGAYLTDWLRFVGVGDVTEIRHESNALLADPAAALQESVARAEKIATTF